MTITLQQLNAASTAEAAQMLDGLYEHSPWIAQAALEERPFKSLAQLKYAIARVVDQAGPERQLALIRAHPELAGKAMVGKQLTPESSQEQNRAGLTQCTREEFERIQQLNTDYNAKFGFPFILAVRGPRGNGLSKREIIDTFARRLLGTKSFEVQECLRNIHRVVELRLNDKFGCSPERGHRVWNWAEQLAVHSDPGFKENGQLTVTYLTQAHQACAAQLETWMRDCGFDEVRIDAVGNVVGRYKAGPHPRPLPEGEGVKKHLTGSHHDTAGEGVKTLLTGSHYDTVRNGGKYDGRLGILVAMECVRELSAEGRRLPFDLEVVGFAEEEGQRYKASFLGSGALIGQFNAAWLEQEDADGITMRKAMLAAGLPGTVEAISAIKRDPSRYLGFVEVHIEQGPVLNELNLPLGIVTSINGSVRYHGEVVGMASHAGTTPMDRRADAALGVAELMLQVEQRAAQDGDSVGTVGMLQVPNGSINVVPGRCSFSLDLRAPNDRQRDALALDVVAGLKAICQRRNLHEQLEQTMRASAAPSAPAWQVRWEQAVQALGVPLHRMPSGAGHDAMKLHEVLPQAMLFVRGINSGISHNPLESSTSDDIELSVQAFSLLLTQLARDQS